MGLEGSNRNASVKILFSFFINVLYYRTMLLGMWLYSLPQGQQKQAEEEEGMEVRRW